MDEISCGFSVFSDFLRGFAVSNRALRPPPQASDVTAYDGCFPKPKQFYFADKHPQKISITTKSIRVCILVSFIFRLVARHRQQEVQIQGKMRLTQIKESQTKKMVQESKKSFFRP